MKAKDYQVMAFVAIAALSSCSQNEEFALDNGQSSYDKNVVTFNTYLGQSANTRATVTDINVMKGDTYPGFGVFAFNTGADNFADASTAVPDFMYNTQVKWKSTEWSYADEKQWPENGKVSFFAYAPYTDAAGTTNITALPAGSVAGDPVISFKMDEDVSKQVDLLYADAKTDQMKETNGGKVQFSFKHALSRVGFKAKLDGEVSGDLKSITITDIIVKSSDLSVSAKLNLRTGEWSDHKPNDPSLGDDDMEYRLQTTDFIAGSNVFGPEDAEQTEPVQLTGDGKYLMLIPTATGSKASMEINVIYVEETSSGEKNTYSVQTPFEHEFEKGKAYNFVFAITPAPHDTPSPNVKFDVVKVESWDNPDAAETNEVPVMSADHKIATVIIHPDNAGIDEFDELYLKGESSRFVVNMAYTGEKSTFVIPDFITTHDSYHKYDKSHPYIIHAVAMSGYELELHGWSKTPVKIWLETDDTDRGKIPEALKDIYIPKCAELEITEGETTHLYPIYIESGF